MIGPSRTSAAVILGLLVALSFGGSLFGEFVWDDGPLIVKNHPVKSGDFGHLLTSSFWDTGDQHDRFRAFFRPVVLASYAAEYALWGHKPLGFRLTNLLLHFACSWLVYRVALSEGFSEGGSLAGAGLFAVHPVHVESVAWISGRTDLFCALFFLASFLAHRRVMRGSGLRAWVAALSFFALALLSKEMAATLPILLFLDRWRRNPGKPSTPAETRARLRAALAHSAPALALLGGYLLLRQTVLAGGIEPLSQVDAVGWLATSVFVVARYVTLLLLPVGLDAHYPFAPFTTLANSLVLVSGAILATVLVLCFRRGGRTQFWILWTLIALLPVLAFGRFGDVILADRFLYLPSVGLAILAAAGFDGLKSWGTRGAGWPRTIPAGLTAVGLIALALLSFDRARIWHDDLALFSDMKKTSPGSALVRCNLGKALYERGLHAEAIEEFRESILLEPRYAMAYNGLGSALEQSGDVRGALRHYAMALRLAPKMLEPAVNLGHLLVEVGQTRRGLELLEKTIASYPGAPEAVFALAHALDGLGRPDRALELLERTRREHPEFARAHYLAGEILLKRGEIAGAADSMQKFLALWAYDDDLRRTAQEIAARSSQK